MRCTPPRRSIDVPRKWGGGGGGEDLSLKSDITRVLRVHASLVNGRSPFARLNGTIRQPSYAKLPETVQLNPKNPANPPKTATIAPQTHPNAPSHLIPVSQLASLRAHRQTPRNMPNNNAPVVVAPVRGGVRQTHLRAETGAMDIDDDAAHVSGVVGDVWRIDASGVPHPARGSHKGVPLRCAFGVPRDEWHRGDVWRIDASGVPHPAPGQPQGRAPTLRGGFPPFTGEMSEGQRGQ